MLAEIWISTRNGVLLAALVKDIQRRLEEHEEYGKQFDFSVDWDIEAKSPWGDESPVPSSEQQPETTGVSE